MPALDTAVVSVSRRPPALSARSYLRFYCRWYVHRCPFDGLADRWDVCTEDRTVA